MAALRVLLGLVIGFGLAFGSQYALFSILGVSDSVKLLIAGILGVIGGAYSALAFGRSVYAVGFFSILGYVLDLSWSMLNTIAALLVWIPACMVAGTFVAPDANSRRSGTFVYTNNPRGGGYAATTIGTAIGGGWSSHEEVHVWQARVFGPLYMPVYLISLLLNLLFRLVTGKLQSLTQEAYYRVCFEDWAYAGGSTGGDNIHWGGWFLWFLLSSVYVALAVLFVVGIITSTILLILVALGGLIVYSLIRAFTPAPARPL